ncbi:hypothetical protein BDV32DRAFT_146948 [Aspergillus pseudonomiae]|uniref:Uncharacterized protein n=1 Tax=Aspergillus pseudonomiae TaxID=1506151 RepID=A0A5N6I8Y8_9EURO|nr:uncharacterized protein BDV37DRAFT_278605 [Aspergillus pseudonomiae]KAB8263161.1 hypothetical protein BDV32DRAFT_146948 [Aspergillus pseudonomiae]KAE8408593.1 hypothetical protein BDV37DRAFT_278605 [Aspergillus pseudonomiae]
MRFIYFLALILPATMALPTNREGKGLVERQDLEIPPLKPIGEALTLAPEIDKWIVLLQAAKKEVTDQGLLAKLDEAISNLSTGRDVDVEKLLELLPKATRERVKSYW